MKVKFKKTHPNAVIPTKATNSAFGYDCVAVSVEPWTFKDDDGNLVSPKDHYVYDLGFALQQETEHADWVTHGFSIRPRSSINKHNAIIRNSPPTIDEDYTGSIKVIMYCPMHDLPMYKVGEKICQLHHDVAYDLEFVEVTELNKTTRGDKGFGSSDKKVKSKKYV